MPQNTGSKSAKTSKFINRSLPPQVQNADRRTAEFPEAGKRRDILPRKMLKYAHIQVQIGMPCARAGLPGTARRTVAGRGRPTGGGRPIARANANRFALLPGGRGAPGTRPSEGSAGACGSIRALPEGGILPYPDLSLKQEDRFAIGKRREKCLCERETIRFSGRRVFDSFA